ncbi:hypothetical protein BdWA1_002444 [Babesia duncani]|uniref:Uncharacterized protein n=1 Tax=Babesia duncani TaxID=323732 RepID=A0AAD9PJQ3_9APIC|nr:hypothetical protein BdWA1_002444 [Babesia duncani]
MEVQTVATATPKMAIDRKRMESNLNRSIEAHKQRLQRARYASKKNPNTTKGVISMKPCDHTASHPRCKTDTIFKHESHTPIDRSKLASVPTTPSSFMKDHSFAKHTECSRSKLSPSMVGPDAKTRTGTRQQTTPVTRMKAKEIPNSEKKLPMIKLTKRRVHEENYNNASQNSNDFTETSNVSTTNEAPNDNTAHQGARLVNLSPMANVENENTNSLRIRKASGEEYVLDEEKFMEKMIMMMDTVFSKRLATLEALHLKTSVDAQDVVKVQADNVLEQETNVAQTNDVPYVPELNTASIITECLIKSCRYNSTVRSDPSESARFQKQQEPQDKKENCDIDRYEKVVDALLDYISSSRSKDNEEMKKVETPKDKAPEILKTTTTIPTSNTNPFPMPPSFNIKSVPIANITPMKQPPKGGFFSNLLNCSCEGTPARKRTACLTKQATAPLKQPFQYNKQPIVMAPQRQIVQRVFTPRRQMKNSTLSTCMTQKSVMGPFGTANIMQRPFYPQPRMMTSSITQNYVSVGLPQRVYTSSMPMPYNVNTPTF